MPVGTEHTQLPNSLFASCPHPLISRPHPLNHLERERTFDAVAGALRGRHGVIRADATAQARAHAPPAW